MGRVGAGKVCSRIIIFQKMFDSFKDKLAIGHNWWHDQIRWGSSSIWMHLVCSSKSMVYLFLSPWRQWLLIACYVPGFCLLLSEKISYFLTNTMSNFIILLLMVRCCVGASRAAYWLNGRVSACALGPDLALLPQGDLTEVGEKGIVIFNLYEAS